MEKKFIYSLCITVVFLAAIPLSRCTTSPAVSENVITQPESAPKIKEQKIVRRYDDNAINMTIHVAWDHLASGRIEPALLDFERLITKGYSHYDVLFGAGMASLKFYDLKKAVRYFTLCIQQRPDHFEALYYRAEVYRQMKMYSQARADLEYLMSNDPASPIICGMYSGEYTDKKLLQRRRDESKIIIQTL
jgi:tetratricopeptide (TPR) repeat protein